MQRLTVWLFSPNPRGKSRQSRPGPAGARASAPMTRTGPTLLAIGPMSRIHLGNRASPRNIAVRPGSTAESNISKSTISTELDSIISSECFVVLRSSISRTSRISRWSSRVPDRPIGSRELHPEGGVASRQPGNIYAQVSILCCPRPAPAYGIVSISPPAPLLHEMSDMTAGDGAMAVSRAMA